MKKAPLYGHYSKFIEYECNSLTHMQHGFLNESVRAMQGLFISYCNERLQVLISFNE